jgi:hypothetical protein
MLGTVDTAMLHQLLSVDPLNLGSTHQYHNHFSIATEHLWSHDIEWHSMKVSRLHCTIELISWTKKLLIPFLWYFPFLSTRSPKNKKAIEAMLTLIANNHSHQCQSPHPIPT